jgi:multidrug efflux pump subunit AcrB
LLYPQEDLSWIPGVGAVSLFGGGEGVTFWLDPGKQATI